MFKRIKCAFTEHDMQVVKEVSNKPKKVKGTKQLKSPKIAQFKQCSKCGAKKFRFQPSFAPTFHAIHVMETSKKLSGLDPKTRIGMRSQIIISATSLKKPLNIIKS